MYLLLWKVTGIILDLDFSQYKMDQFSDLPGISYAHVIWLWYKLDKFE